MYLYIFMRIQNLCRDASVNFEFSHLTNILSISRQRRHFEFELCTYVLQNNSALFGTRACDFDITCENPRRPRDPYIAILSIGIADGLWKLRSPAMSENNDTPHITGGSFSRVRAWPWLFLERGIGLLFSEFVVCKRTGCTDLPVSPLSFAIESALY